MTHDCGHEHQDRRERSEWDDVGRAAEEFARRIARDASHFGERIAEHASAFARHVAREWREHERAGGDWTGGDVRAVLHEVRTIVTGVIDGVDELIERVFHPDSAPAPQPDPASEGWVRVVTSRDATCGGCQRRIEPGEECHLHRTAAGREFRCAQCGPPRPAGAV